MRIRTAQPPPVPQAPSATGARARSGSHHVSVRAHTKPRCRPGPAPSRSTASSPARARSLRCVEHVAAVVAGAIGHDRLERLRLAEGGQDPVGHLHDGRLHAAADVVGLAHPAPGEHGVDRGAVVVDVQPLPAVLGAGIQGEGLVVERQGAEVRDQLLGELVGPVVVGAVGDRDGEPVGLGVGPHRMVRPRLRRVVGGAGTVRRILGEHLVGVEREIAVDLARRNMVEPGHAALAGRLEHGLGADHVGPEEQPRIEDGQGVVRLGGEVDDGVDLLAAEAPFRPHRGRRCHPGRTRSDPRCRTGWVGCRRR